MTLVRKDLEPLHAVTLAVLCGKMADFSSDKEIAAKGSQLRAEWAMLQSPPASTWKEECERDAKRWDLRKRMIEFLEGRDEVEFYPKS